MLLTIAILAITCLVSWMAFKDHKLMQRLLLWPPAIQKKHEYWRLLSYGLVHADFQHLLFNMITLFFFGRALEGFFALPRLVRIPLVLPRRAAGIDPADVHQEPEQRELPQPRRFRRGVGGAVFLHPAVTVVDDHRVRDSGARDPVRGGLTRVLDLHGPSRRR